MRSKKASLPRPKKPTRLFEGIVTIHGVDHFRTTTAVTGGRAAANLRFRASRQYGKHLLCDPDALIVHDVREIAESTPPASCITQHKLFP